MSHFLTLIRLSCYISLLGVTLSRLLILPFSASLCGQGFLDLSVIKNQGNHHNQRFRTTLSGTVSKPVQL